MCPMCPGHNMLKGSLMMKRSLSLILCLLLVLLPLTVYATGDTSAPTISADAITAKYAILIDQDSGEVLFEKDADTVTEPASITKIMTALVAIEKGNLSDQVTVGNEIYEIPSDSSTAGLQKGDTLTLEALLHAMLLVSGNEAANVIAKHIGGTLDAFYTMMNDKAEELGMTNTVYKNAHGYHAEGHVTSARDMARLGRAAMQHEEFRDIVSAKRYTVEAYDNGTTKCSDYTWINKNKLVADASSENGYHYQYATGIKTGFHSAAQNTYVSSATKDGMNLICAVLYDTQEGKWLDATKLFEYGFNNFTTIDVQDELFAEPLNVTVQNASTSDPRNGLLELVPEVTSASYVTKRISDADAFRAKLGELQIKTDFDLESLEAPISEGLAVGNFTYEYDGQVILSGRLKASRAVQKQIMSSTDDLAGDIADGNINIRPVDEGAPNILIIILIVLAALLFVALIFSIVMRIRIKNARRRRASRISKGGVRRSNINRGL